MSLKHASALVESVGYNSQRLWLCEGVGCAEPEWWEGGMHRAWASVRYELLTARWILCEKETGMEGKFSVLRVAGGGGAK